MAEDEMQIYHSANQVAQFAVELWIIFSRRSWLKVTPIEGLTETITYATFSSLNQLPNDVIFIWFTDKNLFALATMKKARNN